MSLDLAALQRKYDARKDNPFRWRSASFGLPSDMLGEKRKRAFQAAIDRWVNYMEQTGWFLQNKPEVTGPFPYRDIGTSLVIPGKSEYRLRAVFATIPKPQRIELGGLNLGEGRRPVKKTSSGLSKGVSAVREVIPDTAA